MGLLLLILLGFVAFRRTKRKREAALNGSEKQTDQESLIEAIAELDLRYEAGDVPEAEYSRRRAELKERAASSERGA